MKLIFIGTFCICFFKPLTTPCRTRGRGSLGRGGGGGEQAGHCHYFPDISRRNSINCPPSLPSPTATAYRGFCKVSGKNRVNQEMNVLLILCRFSALAWLAGVVSLLDLRLSASLPSDNFQAAVNGDGK